MAEAVELAALTGTGNVNDALSAAATAGRFADGDLLSILTFHGTINAGTLATVTADQEHGLQPGTAGWAGFTTASGGTS